MPPDKHPYQTHFQAKDKRLARTLENQPVMQLTKEENIWLSLVSSIMSQQLSTRVADAIYQRFLLHYQNNPTPEKILETPHDTLRSIGLSNAKATYLHNVSRFTIEQGLSFSLLKPMSDEEIISYLTQIKGVGKWTVEMLLIFTLGREDIFALDDLSLQQAVRNIYNIKEENKTAFRLRLQKISAKWSPYRTYASLHLWRHQNVKLARQDTTAKKEKSKTV